MLACAFYRLVLEQFVMSYTLYNLKISMKYSKFTQSHHKKANNFIKVRNRFK